MAVENIAKLNEGQRQAHDTILNAVKSRQGGLFFVHGPGGTGKSFTWDTLALLSGEKVSLSFVWLHLALLL